jgi:hypothetical protein
MTNRLVASLAVLVSPVAGCGGLLGGPASDGGTLPPDAGTEGGSVAEGGDGGGAGWTQCSAPDGVTVCGNGACGNPSGCGCYPRDAGLELCMSSPGYTADVCNEICGQNELCISLLAADNPSTVWACSPWNAGELFAKNGESSRVRYSDFGSWQGSSVPDQLSCPTVTDPVALCGGACGNCAGGRVCTGRSPLHPFGWCTTRPFQTCAPGSISCPPSNACFTYKVDADAQAFANANGYCLATALCDSLAAQLPGGAVCTH